MIERNAVLRALGAVLIAGPAFGDGDCKYKGTTYSHGSAVCQSGTQYRCADGQWKGLAIACTENPPVGASCRCLSRRSGAAQGRRMDHGHTHLDLRRAAGRSHPAAA